MKRAAITVVLLMMLTGFGYQSRPVDPPGGVVKAWSFAQPSGGSGTYWVGGFYEGVTDAATNWSGTASETFGTASATRAAHLIFICGSSSIADTLWAIGSTITDAGVLVEPDTVEIGMLAADTSGQYYETNEKWLGQVTVERKTGAGAARSTIVGFAKYWDNNNNDFTVVGLEVLGRGGATDAALNIKLRPHRQDGWDYRVTGLATGDYPEELAKLNTDHGTNRTLTSGEYFAWKRANLATSVICGADGEGILFEVITTSNNAIESSDFSITFTNN